MRWLATTLMALLALAYALIALSAPSTQVHPTPNDTGLGGLRELVVSLEGAMMVMRLLSRDYFVVLALSAQGNLGRARFELRKAELKLAKEFAV